MDRNSTEQPIDATVLDLIEVHVARFAEAGRRSWRASAVDVACLVALPSTQEQLGALDSAVADSPDAPFDAIEAAIEAAIEKLPAPFSAAARDHFGFANEEASSRPSVTDRKARAAKHFDGKTGRWYRKPNRRDFLGLTPQAYVVALVTCALCGVADPTAYLNQRERGAWSHADAASNATPSSGEGTCLTAAAPARAEPQRDRLSGVSFAQAFRPRIGYAVGATLLAAAAYFIFFAGTHHALDSSAMLRVGPQPKRPLIACRAAAPTASEADACTGFPKPVLNGFRNVPGYGNEQTFVDAQRINRMTPLGGTFTDSLDVVPGDLVSIRIHFDDAARPERSLKNVRALLIVPRRLQTSSTVTGILSATNSSPRVISDTARITSDTPMRLTPVSATARITSLQGFVVPDSPTVWRTDQAHRLRLAELQGKGVSIGSLTDDGIIEPLSPGNLVVTFYVSDERHKLTLNRVYAIQAHTFAGPNQPRGWYPYRDVAHCGWLTVCTGLSYVSLNATTFPKDWDSLVPDERSFMSGRVLGRDPQGVRRNPVTVVSGERVRMVGIVDNAAQADLVAGGPAKATATDTHFAALLPSRPGRVLNILGIASAGNADPPLVGASLTLVSETARSIRVKLVRRSVRLTGNAGAFSLPDTTVSNYNPTAFDYRAELPSGSLVGCKGRDGLLPSAFSCAVFVSFDVLVL